MDADSYLFKVEKKSVECLVLAVDTFITLCPQKLWKHGGREDRKHVRVRGGTMSSGHGTAVAFKNSLYRWLSEKDLLTV